MTVSDFIATLKVLPPDHIIMIGIVYRAEGATPSFVVRSHDGRLTYYGFHTMPTYAGACMDGDHMIDAHFWELDEKFVPNQPGGSGILYRNDEKET